MTLPTRRLLPAILAVLGLGLATARPAAAQITLLQDDGFELGLSGYVRSLTGLYDLGYDAPATDRRSGFNAEVIRAKWSARIGGDVVLEVHNRLQARIAGPAAGSAAGIGVSVVPGRSLDLSTTLVEEDDLLVRHDIDRLALSVYTAAADVTVGRQAITWGTATLFPVADLWTRFSPFELDTEEKPGIDAFRVLFYPASGVEVDAVIADRGVLEDLSAGVRATVSLPSTDLYGAVGKFWDEAVVLAGATVVRDNLKLRAEAALPWNLEADELDRPRVTLGIDRLGARLTVSGEYHYNGIGAAKPGAYAAQLADPRFARGESYFLGRHYLGALAAYTPTDRLNLSLSALANVGDPSAALTALLGYDLGQNVSLSVGAVQSLGEAPVFSPLPALQSEFGTYGDLWFTRISVYF